MWAALRESFAAEEFVPRPVEAGACGIPGKASDWATDRPPEPCLRPGKSVRSRSRARRQLAVSLTAAPVGGFAIVLRQAQHEGQHSEPLPRKKDAPPIASRS